MENYRNFLGRDAFRIGSAADFRAEFGTVDINSGGGVMHLESVSTTTVPGANAAPEDDAVNWSPIVIPVWDGLSAYAMGAIVSQGGANYRALESISAPTAQ